MKEKNERTGAEQARCRAQSSKLYYSAPLRCKVSARCRFAGANEIPGGSKRMSCVQHRI